MTDTTYCSLDDFKLYLNISDSGDDGPLQDALNGAAEAIDQFCGRSFEKDTNASARVYPVECYDALQIDDFYTATSLVIQTDATDSGTYSTTISSAAGVYQLEPLNNRWNGLANWPYNTIRSMGTFYFPVSSYGRATVQVTAKWGWTAVPESVAVACRELARDIWKTKDLMQGQIGFADFAVVRLYQSPVLRNRLSRFTRNNGIV